MISFRRTTMNLNSMKQVPLKGPQIKVAITFSL